MIEQRALKSDDRFRPTEAEARYWRPFTVVGETAIEEPVAVGSPGTARYVTVDDLDDGLASLDISSWPQLDAEGRLYWPPGDDPVETTLLLADLQAWVDARRSARGTTAPDRPLRIGDAFLVRLPAGGAGSVGDAADGDASTGDAGPHATLDLADGVVAVDAYDITKAARTAAKAALFGAAASSVDAETAERLKLDQPYEPTVPDTAAIDVRQHRLTPGSMPSSVPPRPPEAGR